MVTGVAGMSDNYHVRIAKSEHIFSAGHFITFAGNCERLHGHNYRVAVEVSAPLDHNHLVIDFLLLRAKLVEITTWLDHYMLLPTDHPKIRVQSDAREVTVTFEDRRWIFPAGDCRLIPVANTTSELLATFIGRRLLATLGDAARSITCIRVELDECDGQIGVWESEPERSFVV
jgi:6-pyruvoyltetrahydropterin/6-carboxytetrahydropterin synthase